MLWNFFYPKNIHEAYWDTHVGKTDNTVIQTSYSTAFAAKGPISTVEYTDGIHSSSPRCSYYRWDESSLRKSSIRLSKRRLSKEEVKNDSDKWHLVHRVPMHNDQAKIQSSDVEIIYLNAATQIISIQILRCWLNCFARIDHPHDHHLPAFQYGINTPVAMQLALQLHLPHIWTTSFYGAFYRRVCSFLVHS